MLKPKLTWIFVCGEKSLYIGRKVYGKIEFDSDAEIYRVTTLDRIIVFYVYDEALKALEKLALEFFESVIEGATNEP